jgi:hypothetical protein
MHYLPNEGHLYLYATVLHTVTIHGHEITFSQFSTLVQDHSNNNEWVWTLCIPSADEHWKAAYFAMQSIKTTLEQYQNGVAQLVGLDALDNKVQNEIFKKPKEWSDK